MFSSPILLSNSELATTADTPRHPFAGMLDVPCHVDVFLGTGHITVRECLKLQRQSIICLEQSAGSDLDVRAQGVSVAVGEAVVIDERTAVRISAVVQPPRVGGRA